MELLDIPGFLGHLHPLVVHLPIGFLLLAIMFDLLSYHSRYAYLKAAVPVTLFAGFISAVAACIFGYLLSLSGNYDDTTLSNHKFAGIILTIISGLLFLVTTPKGKSLITVPAKLFSLLFLGLAVLMAYAGHQGGSLTHGNTYLSIETLTQQRREKPANVEDAMIFEDVVHPVLESRCGQCHGAGRLKGKLSIKTLASLLKGGKHGAAVIPGKLAESELFKRITLDPDNEGYMPANGKTPLTKNEVEIIRWWIEKAMAAEGKPIVSFKDKEMIKPRVAVFLGLSKTLPGEAATAIAQHINPDIPQTANTAVIQKLRNKGLMVRVMLQQPIMLDITLPEGSGKKMADIKEDVKLIAKNIIWLNLSGNGFTDKDLDFLHLLTNIEKLRLEKNPVSDNIIEQLTGLQHLEAVNLNETNITSTGLGKLEKNAALKRIYSWKTAVK
jgi:uncharacterized membrane protein/mono/diheme cytochrome c family protein